MIEHPGINAETTSSLSISEQELAALRSELAFYRAALRAFPNDMLLLFDTDMRYVAAGGNPIDALEINPQDLPGHTAQEIIPAAMQEQVLEHYEQALSGKSSQTQTCLQNQRLAIDTVPLYDESGTLIGGMAVHRFITSNNESELEVFKELVERTPFGIATGTMDGLIAYTNPAYLKLTGMQASVIGEPFSVIYGPEGLEQSMQGAEPLQQHGFWSAQIPALHPDGSPWITQVTAYMLDDRDNGSRQWAAFYSDVTDQVRLAEERTEFQKETLAAQEHALAAQEAALRELSTPLIPITDKVVVMPLVGSIDSRRAQMVMESLLEGVSRIQAQTVILDITGVPIVDTQVANALLHATQALKLLGARVLLTGIRPEVAQTLVSLGTDLGMIEISRDLRSAISTVLR